MTLPGKRGGEEFGSLSVDFHPKAICSRSLGTERSSFIMAIEPTQPRKTFRPIRILGLLWDNTGKPETEKTDQLFKGAIGFFFGAYEK